ncbi:Citrate lyase acyl carrier protein [Bibersteinia trehalosi USDA-ARS-USMARC-188]|uniref:Citrate lyase acyl carrier protein n=5 Tax=Bibersteinia trehalosi TaxID=47735 RepID=W0R7W1_BIBTR|nr:citrate lyase acyl carrier protein [Bibersteinia trehalosi]AGH38567.1 Citrate lyase acyl carrier protein [Bibersteinia trehalosi USDA-ARS-USMARC-192]AHG81632.1 Citrate lyase acyl carrier protein [Bibersteinia trehalosi USDA-ARS-USMARC-188]AHG83912.1 Citrate lyase acyl carrier protein [Bibersteinia trehalosi USDA-ARS-USMARC-189]AHG86552.1 Citrate lyase acyl carrier protein [Bibersteinia trehalosi USDA-ARS-USMARC-190]OAQ14794.1 citrate lyase subunit gamma [Bibersteinia trehalosi Y31]
MQITKAALAGTLESSDALIRVAPAQGLDIEINSSVGKQFGDQIEATVKSVLAQLNVTHAQVIVEDKGALDCVLQARLKAALQRATDEPINWEKML